MRPETIRLLVSGELHTQMRQHFGDELHIEVFPVAHRVGVRMTHKPSGLSVKVIGHKNAFEGKREALAQLVEQIDHHYGPINEESRTP